MDTYTHTHKDTQKKNAITLKTIDNYAKKIYTQKKILENISFSLNGHVENKKIEFMIF